MTPDKIKIYQSGEFVVAGVLEAIAAALIIRGLMVSVPQVDQMIKDSQHHRPVVTE
jgi:hypothetical protein